MYKIMNVETKGALTFCKTKKEAEKYLSRHLKCLRQQGVDGNDLFEVIKFDTPTVRYRLA